MAIADLLATTLDLAKQLIGRPSIAPDDGGCLELIASRLAESGFSFERMDRGKPPVRVSNLWARHGTEPPLVCLAGHVDVAPVLPTDRWSSDPFVPIERKGCLFGRGAADMKTAIAAMITAAERLVAAVPNHSGSLAIALTSNEEATKPEGTLAIAQQLQWRGDAIDACILGKPTSKHVLGDTIVNGRCGWLKGVLTVGGIESHPGDGEQWRNPIRLALPALAELAATASNSREDELATTSLEISHVHAGSGTSSRTPASLDVHLNVRFSTASVVDEVEARVREVLVHHGIHDEVRWTLVREPYVCPRGRLVDVLSSAVAAVTGVTPELSTGGRASDGSVLATVGREIVEFGPVGRPAGTDDECVPLADIAPLSQIYEQVIVAWLARRDGDV